mgnify:FL=1
MTTIRVETARPYEVHVGAGLLDQLGVQLRARCKSGRAVIVSDDHVAPLHGAAAERSLNRSGFSTEKFIIPSGEASKCGEIYIKLLRFLAAHQITRTDVLVALGGGVVGDLTGFAAATYLRGVPFVQVPTTLLAAVDSSVGGKTAIDLPEGKNLVGAFYQPMLVLCDIDTLNTLPPEIFADGCAEVIKYGILGDKELFTQLEKSGLQFDRESVIAASVRMKRDVVSRDEFDTGVRQLLNLGHTFAHGIESCSGYTIPHGRAVAAGTAIIARAAAAKGYCTDATVRRIESILTQFGLPIRTKFTASQLAARALSDKKRDGDAINLIVPRAIGTCDRVSVPVSELALWAEAGV